jgi:hypothetical protein
MHHESSDGCNSSANDDVEEDDRSISSSKGQNQGRKILHIQYIQNLVSELLAIGLH